MYGRDVVARMRILVSGRGFWIVLTASTGRLVVLAGLGRLQQRKPEFAFGSGNLLGFRRHWRQPAIGRIDNARRTQSGTLLGRERVVVGAGDVRDGPALRTLIAAQHLRSLLVQVRALGLGEEFLIAEPGRTLQRRVGLIGPDALQIRLAPRRLHDRGRGLS